MIKVTAKGTSFSAELGSLQAHGGVHRLYMEILSEDFRPQLQEALKGRPDVTGTKDGCEFTLRFARFVHADGKFAVIEGRELELYEPDPDFGPLLEPASHAELIYERVYAATCGRLVGRDDQDRPLIETALAFGNVFLALKEDQDDSDAGDIGCFVERPWFRHIAQRIMP